MKFRVQRREPVKAGLVRVASLRAAKAVARTRGLKGRQPDSVHQVRVTIKRLRSMWRLVRPVVPAALYGRHNTRLRTAARMLSDARDALIVEKAVHRIRREAPDKTTRHHIELAHQRVTSRRTADAAATPWSQIVPVLRGAAQGLGRIKSKKHEWELIRSGLDRAYRRARDAATTAPRERTDAAHHEWRKRVKDLQYQLELVVAAWPKRLRPMLADLRALSRLLGQDHDLAVLTQRIGPLPRPGPSRPALLRVKRLIRARQRKLRAKAKGYRRPLFADAPDQFLERLADHWAKWRD